MAFGHEKLDVYRAAIEYVGWAYRFCEGLDGHRNAKDQLLRASQALSLNIAEGNRPRKNIMNANGKRGPRRPDMEIWPTKSDERHGNVGRNSGSGHPRWCGRIWKSGPRRAMSAAATWAGTPVPATRAGAAGYGNPAHEER
jgi:hypothetical protein